MTELHEIQKRQLKRYKIALIIFLLSIVVAGIYIAVLKKENRAIKIEKKKTEIVEKQNQIDTISKKEEEVREGLSDKGNAAEKKADELIKSLPNEKHIIADTTRLYKFGFVTRK